MKSFRRGNIGRGLAIVVILVAAASWACAAEDDPLASGKERHLNGHGFLPSVFVDDPFVASTFQNLTGGGIALDLQTTFRDLDGTELGALTGNVLFATLGLGYQQKLGDRWAVGAVFAAQIRAGTNVETFISEGADMNREGGLWAKYRVKRSDRAQLTVGLTWDYSSVVYFTPLEFAEHIADGGGLDDAPLVVNTKYWTTRVAVQYVHAFSPKFGIRANGAFGLYEDPIETGVSKGSHRIGVMGEYDLKHTRAGVPVGFSLGYTQTLPDTDPFTGLSGALLGIWYTGKEEFVVGVEAGNMKQAASEQSNDKVKAIFGVITIRYYF